MTKSTSLFLSILLTVLCAFQAFSQKNKTFTGRLEYKITPRDTSLRELIPENKMIVYCNDTIVRVENFTSQLGTQVTIRHMALDKSYLLIAADFGKFAIRSDMSESDTATVDPDKVYSFKKKCFKRKILGRKAKRVVATHKGFQAPIEFLYLKGYSTKIVNPFPEIDGIPVRYSLVSHDAVLDYELVKISEYSPERDLFGIPSDYEKVDFNFFMDKLIESKSGMSGE